MRMLRIYNTLSGEKEVFSSKKVKMYVCGMTAYADAHVGHARTYVVFDVVRRYLEYKGYEVKYVQNITDVDDKIIRAASELGVDPLDYSKEYTRRCLRDMDDLGIRRADLYPKATEHISDMIEMIQKLVEEGYAYVSNGDVYFSVRKFKSYGKLSGHKLGAKGSSEPKRHPEDFALWKGSEEKPCWDSPWGKGRPGWHIECSAMSMKYLDEVDIHGGGRDLIFPHHENEIAQSESLSGFFVRYWMHTGYLTINREKMSKSLGNIVSIREILEKYDPEVIRFFFVSTHYRSPIDFSYEALEKAKRGLERIYRLKDRLESRSKDGSPGERDSRYLRVINEFQRKFEDAMDDDFDTPDAIASMFEFVNETNKYLRSLSPDLCTHAHDTLVKIGRVLTLFQEKRESEEILDGLRRLIEKYGRLVTDESDLDELMRTILDLRQSFRNKHDWTRADEIRDSLRKLGLEIEDTKDGTIWRIKL